MAQRFGATEQKKGRCEVNELLREILAGRLNRQSGDEKEAVADAHRSPHDQGDSDMSDCSSDDDFWSAGASADVFVGRVNALVEALVDMGCD